ncbi:MAG: aspartate-semialdehyde dehydrogenase [Candidatus Omnitrophica bacterium]|nr:aspartate-semialdehyde dehydrogenase [Candidatus Omnitrophota bacterium]
MRRKNKYNIAVVGVGAVGIEMLRVLRQRNFPVAELRVFARSAREIDVDGQKYQVQPISAEGFDGIDIALFAGTEGEKGASVTFAGEAVKRGAVVIDNGADFRMDPDVPLVVPEANPKDAKKYRKKGIIANPNCSTIQMIVALSPIHNVAKIKRIIVSTYQAASGAGRGAVEQLKNELSALNGSGYQEIRLPDAQDRALPQQLAFNVFPHIGGFAELDYTSEEWKMVKETHKIFHSDKIKVSATTARVAVRTGHSEAVYIETKKDISVDEIRGLLKNAPGVELVDNPKENFYPLPIDCEGKDAVYVGRIRKDPFVKNGFWLWVVSDNLRKGAALNAVQIAELLIAKK